MIKTAVSLAKEVDDEDKQGFIIAGILSATDKFIDKNYSNRLKEWLKMTKVGRLFEEEKLEAIYEKTLEIAKKMLEKNVDILTIMESTGLRKAEILKLKDELAESKD
jgi:predicted transposase YdaD